MNYDYSTTILALDGDADISISGADIWSNITWNDGNPNNITEKQVIDKQAALQTAYDAEAYARTRKPLYPDIGDQLDDLYHAGVFSAGMIAKLKKVKDDNPK
jgi:hypothetical protein